MHEQCGGREISMINTDLLFEYFVLEDKEMGCSLALSQEEVVCERRQIGKDEKSEDAETIFEW